MYDFLSSHRELLLAANSPLMNFARQKVRYVFRATRTYQIILNNSFAPDVLKSGIDRSISLDVFSRAFLTDKEKPNFWSILDAELQAVEELDIPFFSVDTSSASLELPTGVAVSELFEKPTFETVINRLKSFDETNLQQQLEIIRGSFCARFIEEPSCVVSPNRDRTLLSKYIPLAPEELVREAVFIAQELQQQGIYDGDSVSWIGLGLRTNTPGFELQGLSDNLYDGSSGVALFLSALAKVTGNSDWQNLAQKTLQPLCRDLQDLKPEVAKRLKREGIGGATGLGSIVYSLVEISQLMPDAELIDAAKKAASLMTTDLIERDCTFNSSGGTAGMILACLKLYEIEPSAIESAILGGEHLLKHQNSISKHLKAGFAHGAAGVAYALLRLFEITQDARFLAGAEKIISDEQNWHDLDSKKSIYNSWANGAAGIGLGRLGSLTILDTEAIRAEIDRAIAITQKYCLEDVDNLAWGNLGRIETLLVASQKLNRPDIFDFALQAVTTLVKQARLRGRFNLCSPSVPVAYNPGFFQGTTGIGYQLLRIAHPDLLPSILLWE